MSPPRRLPRPLRPHRRGFTLVEAAIASVLVGGLLVTAMNLLGASRLTQARYADREFALVLADDLLQEILAQPYADPEDDTRLGIGLNVGETLSLRLELNDADDYDGYRDEPPVDGQGNAIAGAAAFYRSVEVQYVDPSAPDTAVSSDLGVKRVRVAVGRGSIELITLTGYVTADWPAADQLSEPTQ